MAVDVANEPYQTFQAKLAAILATTAVGARVSQTDPMALSGFPCVTWKVSEDAPGKTDAEAWLERDQTVQINIWSDDPDQGVTLALAIDEGLNDACVVGALNSANWSCKVLRRQGGWRSFEWERRQLASGNILIQRSSDWRYRVARKQST